MLNKFASLKFHRRWLKCAYSIKLTLRTEIPFDNLTKAVN